MTGTLMTHWLSGADDPQRETVHDADCFACDVARDLVELLGCYWDPHDNWPDVPAGDGVLGVPGDTVEQQTRRMVAFALHRRLPGHDPAPLRRSASQEPAR